MRTDAFDLARPREFVQGVIGQTCTRVCARPGWTMLLDFGPLGPLRSSARPRPNPTLIGEWAVVAWGAEVWLRSPSGETVHGNLDEKDPVVDAGQRLVGLSVTSVEILSARLNLELSFADGSRLLVVPCDDADETGDDQWSVLSPSATISVKRPGEWIETLR